MGIMWQGVKKNHDRDKLTEEGSYSSLARRGRLTAAARFNFRVVVEFLEFIKGPH